MARRQSAARRAGLAQRRAASHSARKPSFDATNPAGYNWGDYDALLAEAQRLKWQVLLTVTAPVPKWATAAKKDYVTRPDSRDFKEFMTAVGKHFGSEVSLFAIWNEANHPAFLLPQFSSNGKPASPRIYRALFQAGYEGLQAGGLAQPKVLMGETAPIGYDSLTRGEYKANPASRRGAARVPARSAVPERPLPQVWNLRRAASLRLRAPCVHAGRSDPLQNAGTRQRHDRRALAALERARQGARPRTRFPRTCRYT